jgi:hypothetical protein
MWTLLKSTRPSRARARYIRPTGINEALARYRTRNALDTERLRHRCVCHVGGTDLGIRKRSPDQLSSDGFRCRSRQCRNRCMDALPARSRVLTFSDLRCHARTCLRTYHASSISYMGYYPHVADRSLPFWAQDDHGSAQTSSTPSTTIGHDQPPEPSPPNRPDQVTLPMPGAHRSSISAERSLVIRRGRCLVL